MDKDRQGEGQGPRNRLDAERGRVTWMKGPRARPGSGQGLTGCVAAQSPSSWAPHALPLLSSWSSALGVRWGRGNVPLGPQVPDLWGLCRNEPGKWLLISDAGSAVRGHCRTRLPALLLHGPKLGWWQLRPHGQCLFMSVSKPKRPALRLPSKESVTGDETELKAALYLLQGLCTPSQPWQQSRL